MADFDFDVAVNDVFAAGDARLWREFDREGSGWDASGGSFEDAGGAAGHRQLEDDDGPGIDSCVLAAHFGRPPAAARRGEGGASWGSAERGGGAKARTLDGWRCLDAMCPSSGMPCSRYVCAVVRAAAARPRGKRRAAPASVATQIFLLMWLVMAVPRC